LIFMEDLPRREADLDRIGLACGILSEEVPLVRIRRPANALPNIDRLHETMNEIRQEFQRNYADQRRNMQQLQGNMQQLEGNMQRLNATVANLEVRVERTDVLASVRARNATADWSRLIAFPPNMAGEALPEQLAGISGFQLSQLDAPQLNQYVRFYGLRGRTRAQKLEQLCIFLGCPS